MSNTARGQVIKGWIFSAEYFDVSHFPGCNSSSLPHLYEQSHWPDSMQQAEGAAGTHSRPYISVHPALFTSPQKFGGAVRHAAATMEQEIKG